jgi:hypothetical protein
VVQHEQDVAQLYACGSLEAGYVEVEWKDAGLWVCSQRASIEVDFGSEFLAQAVAFGTACSCAASVSSYANGVLSIELRRGFRTKTRFSWVSRIIAGQR